MERIEKRLGIASEIRAVRSESGDRVIEGYAARFNKYSEDLGGFKEKIKPGAFSDAIKNSDVRALFNHDPNIVLGRSKAGTLTLKEDKKGLHMSVTLPNTRTADELMESIERGDITQQSFGFTIAEDSWRMSEKYGEVRTIEKIDRLFDVSPVTFPAYPDTEVALRSLAAWKEGPEPEPEKTDEVRHLIERLHAAIIKDDPTDVEPTQDDVVTDDSDVEPTQDERSSDNMAKAEEVDRIKARMREYGV